MSDLFDLRRTEVPWALPDRLILASGRPVSVWFDAFRVHSPALLFSSTLTWDPSGASEEPDDWPDLTGTRPGREPVRVEVLADGALWVNDPRNEHPLDFCNASAVPGFATASWWIPVVPRTLQFTVQTNLLPDTVHAGIDATGWQEVVDQVVRLDSNADEPLRSWSSGR